MIQKWKKKILIAGLLIIGVMVLFSVFSIQLNLDFGMILIGAAFLVIAFTIYSGFQYAARPKKQIHLINKISLTSPPNLLKPFRTYRLHVSSKYEIEEKGKSREVNLDEVNITFNKSDHPNIYEYCMMMVGNQVQRNQDLLKKKHPGAVFVDTENVFQGELLKLKEKSD